MSERTEPVSVPTYLPAAAPDLVASVAAGCGIDKTDHS
jgi:hypothetical protein